MPSWFSSIPTAGRSSSRPRGSITTGGPTVFRSTSAMTKNIVDGSFQGSIDLRPGSYYLALTASGTTDSGGAVQRVTVAGETAAAACAPAAGG
uniref:Uncharacterized protein n=1 Tax=Candidatus Giovannonibacteria bacterium GW2011_GWF2_42_19 TaxID=1618659 RepID=A0A0G0ZE19_9BACT|nr:MAG: hypothetical protein UV11_C0021G0001 [Candidatus Giovannonibacteria bacterium GW2011_GWF2_42_19]